MREKPSFLYLAALAALYLSDRGCEITDKDSGQRGKSSSEENDSWVPAEATHESTMYREACRRARESTGNKSPSVPKMKTASPVSPSKQGDSAACRSERNMARCLSGYPSKSRGRDGNPQDDSIGSCVHDAAVHPQDAVFECITFTLNVICALDRL